MTVRALDRLETGLNYLSASILFGLMFYVVAEVGMRYLFNHPLPGHLELSEMLVAPAAFLALSYVQARHGHVGVDIVRDHLSARARGVLDAVTVILALVTFAIIAWVSGANTWLAFTVGDVTPTAHVTTWWSKAAVPVGSVLLCARLVVQLVEIVTALRRS